MDLLSASSFCTIDQFLELPSGTSEDPGSGSGNSDDDGEERAGSRRERIFSLLQSPFFLYEGDWGLETEHRSLPFEHVYFSNVIQDEDGALGHCLHH